MQKIIEINHPSISFNDGTSKIVGKRRVAAYCRVSTLREEQEMSFEAQCDYYRHKFSKSSDFELAGIFGDNGISGTQISKRHGFQSMLIACQQGKIDEIWTKSISRFARNFTDCLTYIKKFKELGVTVRFESEGFSTDDENMEILLSIMAIVAQEESNSISQAVTWGMENMAKQGEPPRRAPYGYYKSGKTVDGVKEWTIKEDEAERIRLVFHHFLAGESQSKIARILESFEIQHGHTRNWSREGVHIILKNEAYCGDVLFRKYFVPDYLSKKCRANHGERPMYYLKDHHNGIVSRQEFQVAQELLEKNRKVYSPWNREIL